MPKQHIIMRRLGILLSLPLFYIVYFVSYNLYVVIRGLYTPPLIPIGFRSDSDESGEMDALSLT